MVEFSSSVLRVFIMTINNKSERNYRGTRNYRGKCLGWLVTSYGGADPEKPFSSPEAALLLVSTKNRDLWLETSGQVQHRKSANHGLPVTLRMFRVRPDKSDWLWFQTFVFTKPFKHRMSFEKARGRDSWC